MPVRRRGFRGRVGTGGRSKKERSKRNSDVRRGCFQKVLTVKDARSKGRHERWCGVLFHKKGRGNCG